MADPVEEEILAEFPSGGHEDCNRTCPSGVEAGPRGPSLQSRQESSGGEVQALIERIHANRRAHDTSSCYCEMGRLGHPQWECVEYDLAEKLEKCGQSWSSLGLTGGISDMSCRFNPDYARQSGR